MRTTPKLAALIAIFLVTAALAGCSNDQAGGKHKTDAGLTPDASDVSPQADAGEDAPADAAADTAPEDTGVAPDGGAAMDASDVSDAGTDTADVGVDSGLADAGHSGCTFPADPDAGCPVADQGLYGPASFISQFVVKKSGECCADLDGDGTLDSAVGDLAASMQSMMGVPFNDIIAAEIQHGMLIYLLEYAYWDDPANDGALQLDLVFGQDESPDFTDNLAGTGNFLIDSTTLDAQGHPLSDFDVASVTNGRLSVTGGNAPLVLPVGADLVEIGVQQLSLQADVDSSADLTSNGRVALSNGQLSGVITLDEMFSALNTVAQGCSCISSDPLFTEQSPDSYTCSPAASEKQACDSDPSASDMCKTLASKSGCTTVAAVMTQSADLDLNSDPGNDALSLGATFEAVGASIRGTTP